jgi:phosphatidylserine/phosphatidylglycerophosphate/cardiolipin synthase-like enzyme
MSLPSEGLMDFFSGKIFFLVVIIIAILVVLYAKQDSFVLPQAPPFNQNNSTSWFGVDVTKLNPQSAFPQTKNVAAAQVFFCPDDECGDKLVQRIDSAQKSIYVAIYSFTLDSVADALIRAKQRGVEVKVVFDYDQSNNTYSDDEKLQLAGIAIARRNGSGYMHNKFMVIDETTIATGSFNYSVNADTKNDENLIFIESTDLASKYKADFDHLWDISDKA